MNGPGGLVIDPILPIPVIAVAGVLILALTIRIYWTVGASIGRWRRLTLLILRVAGLAMVIILLLQPSRSETLPPVTAGRVTLVGLDTSRSMKQQDAGNESRFDAAKGLLQQAGLVNDSGLPASQEVQLFGIDSDAHAIEKSILDIQPTGTTTLFHKSIDTMLNAPSGDQAINAVILLTDGHDFEMINPVKTGMEARDRQAPIYAVALGQQGHVRNVAVRITGYQPYCYVRQTARIQATLRLTGCELEDLTVQLLREGKVVQTKHVNAEQLEELPVEFDVAEPQIGQYEYEVHVQPLPMETDASTNSAITYLNVIDQQIRVLLLEGDPYWDTTFLQRSLMRDDKLDVDSMIGYGNALVRAIRKTQGVGPLVMPQTVDQLAAYDVVILGRAVDTLPDSKKGTGLANLLDQYVRDRGGAVIFSRGEAFTSATSSWLDPVIWSGNTRDHVHMDATAEGRALSPFQVMSDAESSDNGLPDLVDQRIPTKTEPLTSVMAIGASREDPSQQAAIVHRRYGSGQVVSIGVDGLWRWSLNPKVDVANSPFDRFWDQTILWLVSARDVIPNRQFSFRPNSANIQLGEKVYFRLVQRQPDPNVKAVPVKIYYNDADAGSTTLAPSPGSVGRLTADFLPQRTGRYRAVATLPDGTTQESRFVVFTQDLEETEVATDPNYLRQLCEASGGRLLDASELPDVVKGLAREKSDETPKVLTEPVWDEAWVCYSIAFCFGMDWFLRRRWGLS
jgi:hypothetical protein